MLFSTALRKYMIDKKKLKKRMLKVTINIRYITTNEFYYSTK